MKTKERFCGSNASGFGRLPQLTDVSIFSTRMSAECQPNGLCTSIDDKLLPWYAVLCSWSTSFSWVCACQVLVSVPALPSTVAHFVRVDSAAMCPWHARALGCLLTLRCTSCPAVARAGSAPFLCMEHHNSAYPQNDCTPLPPAACWALGRYFGCL